jgi:hypothetical protein
MATRFQCDVCGGVGEPAEHTHDISVRSRRDEHHERHRMAVRRDLEAPVIGGMDTVQTVEVCLQCNDEIRKFINELSAKKKTAPQVTSSGRSEA